MNYIKRILVGIDFSEASKNALTYAYNLSGELGATIKVIHVYGSNFKPSDLEVPAYIKNRSDYYNRKLTELVSQLPLHPVGATLTKVKIDCVTAHGFAVPQIIKAAQAEYSDLIVVGMSQSDYNKDKKLGSNAAIIAQRATCPVLVVPESHTYTSFENILYASDSNTASDSIIQRNIAFANTFRASMHFVHVKQSNVASEDEIQKDIFQVLMDNVKPGFAYKLATLPPASIAESLIDYAKKNKIDLIVLINQKERFIDNILNRSVTLNMSKKSHLPILVYQE